MAERRTSILVKFGTLVGITILLCFTGFTIILTSVANSSSTKKFEESIDTELQLLSYALGPQLYNFDANAIQSTILSYLKSPGHLSASIFDEKDKSVYSSPPVAGRGTVVTYKRDLLFNNNKIGRFEVLIDHILLEEQLRDSVIVFSLMSLILLFLVLIVLYFLLSSVILKPLHSVETTVVDLDQGDGDLTKQIRVLSHDEIGKLSQHFNSFLGNMRKIVEEIKKSVASLIEVKDSLHQNSNETNASLVEINANMESMKTQIQALDDQILGSSAAVEEISANIASMNKMIDDQGRAVADSTSAVNEMVASVNSVAAITETKKRATEKLFTVTKTGGEKLTQTIGVVTEINNSLGSISSLIKIINQISSQTNLLAMNAAIEAAHAGDAGRGFSVVADEIRKLAESSSTNSKGISEILKNISQKIAQASSFAQETGKAFELISQEVQDVNQAFSEITSSTSELSVGGAQIVESMALLQEISENVRSGSREMEAGAGSMTKSMTNVRQISSEVLVGIQEIAAGSKLIGTAVSEINVSAEQVDSATSQVGAAIEKFKT